MTGLGPQLKPVADRAGNLVVQLSRSMGMVGIYINYGRPPLDDARIGQAICYGINRAARNRSGFCTISAARRACCCNMASCLRVVSWLVSLSCSNSLPTPRMLVRGLFQFVRHSTNHRAHGRQALARYHLLFQFALNG